MAAKIDITINVPDDLPEKSYQFLCKAWGVENLSAHIKSWLTHEVFPKKVGDAFSRLFGEVPAKEMYILADEEAQKASQNAVGADRWLLFKTAEESVQNTVLSLLGISENVHENFALAYLSAEQSVKDQVDVLLKPKEKPPTPLLR